MPSGASRFGGFGLFGLLLASSMLCCSQKPAVEYRPAGLGQLSAEYDDATIAGGDTFSRRNTGANRVAMLFS